MNRQTDQKKASSLQGYIKGLQLLRILKIFLVKC